MRILLLVYLLTITSLYSQVDVRIDNLYNNESGETVNYGTPIKLYGNSTRIALDVILTKPHNKASVGYIRAYYKRDSDASGINLGANFYVCTSCWSSYTSFHQTINLDLLSSYFNEKGGSIYVTYEEGSGPSHFSKRWAVEKHVGPIKNNSISSSHQINNGQTARKLTGSNPKGGNGSYDYQWQKNTNNKWVDISDGYNKDYSPGKISITTRYQRIVKSADQVSTSNSVTITVTNYPSITNNSISGNQTITEGNLPNKLLGSNPAGGNKKYKYTWQSKKTSGNWEDLNDSNNRNYQPTILDETTYFRRKVKSATLISYSNEIKIKVNPLPPISNNTFYYDGNSQLIGSTPSGGNGKYEYSWEIYSPDLEGEPQKAGTAKDHSKIPGNLTFYYRRTVKSYNKTSTTPWQTIHGLLRNNTIAFDGKTKILGSTPSGGTKKYHYEYYFSLMNSEFGTLEDTFSNTTIDKELPRFYLHLLKAYPDTKVRVNRLVSSGIEKISSNTIEINSSSFKKSSTRIMNSKTINLDELNYNLYPNPVKSKGTISLNLNSKLETNEVEIILHHINNFDNKFKLKGKSNGQEINFELPEMKLGVYTYNLFIEGHFIKSGKLIVKK